MESGFEYTRRSRSVQPTPSHLAGLPSLFIRKYVVSSWERVSEWAPPFTPEVRHHNENVPGTGIYNISFFVRPRGCPCVHLGTRTSGTEGRG